MGERPAMHMTVMQYGWLKPADAYSEQTMRRYQVGSEIDVRPLVDMTYWKRRRYWQILDLVIERCNTPWKSSDEAHEVLKLACGVVTLSVSPLGKEVVFPGTTTTMENPEFDDFYDAAMIWLYETTGVDPETMEKEVGDTGTGAEIDKELDDSPANSLGETGDGGGAMEAPPKATAVADDPIVMVHSNIAGSIEADERAMVNSGGSMSTAELKQEAIQKILDLYLDPSITDEERRDNLGDAYKIWKARMPGHPEFLKTVFETAAKVMRGELQRPAATKYLYGLRDG